MFSIHRAVFFSFLSSPEADQWDGAAGAGTIAGTLRGSWITDAREAVREARYGRAHKILTATELRKKKRKRPGWRLHALEKGFMCGAGGGQTCQRKEPSFCSAVTTQPATVKLSESCWRMCCSHVRANWSQRTSSPPPPQTTDLRSLPVWTRQCYCRQRQCPAIAIQYILE